MEPRGQQVVARIGFAEQWLNQAKRQCTEGNLARGWLTLVLADAEMRRALHAADPAMRPPRSRAVPALVAGAVVVVVSALGVAAWWPGRSRLSVAPAPPIVRLAAPVGPLLEFVLPSSATPAASVAKPAPPQEASRLRQAATRRAPQAGASTSKSSTAAIRAAPVPPSTPAVAPATVVVVPSTHSPQIATSQTDHPPAAGQSSLELSTAELIDLVLAAERTLRGDANRP